MNDSRLLFEAMDMIRYSAAPAQPLARAILKLAFEATVHYARNHATEYENEFVVLAARHYGFELTGNYPRKLVKPEDPSHD